MVFSFIGGAIGSWCKDVFRLHDAIFARSSGEARGSVSVGDEAASDVPSTTHASGNPPKPRKVRPYTLQDRFGLISGIEPKAVVEFIIERWLQKDLPETVIRYTTREFADPIEAIRNLAPFTATGATRYLFLRGGNGTHCVLPNGGYSGVSVIAKLVGFDGLDVNYQTQPWHHYVAVQRADGFYRHINSATQSWGDVDFFQTDTPLEFEDPEAIKRLKKGKPIGRGEIAKFCELFGWPLPISREGLEFITGAVMYEITPVRGTEYVSEEQERAITLIPPAWLGEEVDLFAAPAEDPVIAKREAARRKWAKFRRAFSAELKERFGEVRCVLVLPRDGVERCEDCIDVIAPDDGTLLKGFEERAVTDAVLLGSFFVEAEVIGMDEHSDVYVTLEITAKPEGEKADWRIGYDPGADTPVPAYEGEHRALMNVKDTYAG